MPPGNGAIAARSGTMLQCVSMYALRHHGIPLAMPRTLVGFALISIYASLLLWILELGHALAGGGWESWPAAEILSFALLTFLLFAGWAVAATLGQWGFVSLLSLLHRRIASVRGEARARTYTALAATAALAPAVAYFTLLLFSGKGISRFAHLAVLRASFLVLSLLGVFSLASLIAALARGWFLPARRFARGFSVAAGAFLIVLLYGINARWYVGQYEFVHRALCILIFLLTELLVASLLGPQRIASVPGGAAARLLLLIAFLMPCELAILSRVVAGTPGSRILSAVYSRMQMGKHLMRLYRFKTRIRAGDWRMHAEYLAARDAFSDRSTKIDRKGCNLIWIYVDSLRASNLPMYGYPRDTSPRLRGFAARAALFMHAYAQGTMTQWSVPATMTGCYYSTLMRRGDVEALTGILARHGYQTFVANAELMQPFLRRWDRAGFDQISAGDLTAPEVTRAAVAMLQRRIPGRPFCFFLFYGEPHFPYTKHAGFDYGNREEDCYDSEIAFTDRHIGDLLDEVRRAGLLDSTIVVITADHGEELGRHGGWGHSRQLYDENIHVPLIVSVPGVPPRVVASAVQCIDIVPALVGILGLSTNAHRDGGDIAPFLQGLHPPYTPRVYSEVAAAQPESVCLIHYPWKLIYYPRRLYFDLFNLVNDPLERHNRFKDAGAIGVTLQEMLLSWIAYRDRDTAPREAESPGVATIVDRIRSRAPEMFASLDDLDVEKISPRDFALLQRELQPYPCRETAAFYLLVARSAPRLRQDALGELARTFKAAHESAGKTGIPAQQRDAASGVASAFDAPGVAEFLLSIVREGNNPSEAACLGLIRDARLTRLSDDLFDLYQRRRRRLLAERLFPPFRIWRWLFPGRAVHSEDWIFETLCSFGDPRVADRLVRKVETLSVGEQIDSIQYFVYYHDERCRDALLRLHERHASSAPEFTALLASQIGASRNPFMLPVLRRIFTCPSDSTQPSALPFAKKEAILHFIDIKGRHNLSREDRAAILGACRGDPDLGQFREIKELCLTL